MDWYTDSVITLISLRSLNKWAKRTTSSSSDLEYLTSWFLVFQLHSLQDNLLSSLQCLSHLLIFNWVVCLFLTNWQSCILHSRFLWGACVCVCVCVCYMHTHTWLILGRYIIISIPISKQWVSLQKGVFKLFEPKYVSFAQREVHEGSKWSEDPEQRSQWVRTGRCCSSPPTNSSSS